MAFAVESAIFQSIPAPTRGWITALPLDQMPDDSAVIMDNYFVNGEEVKVRPGSTLYCNTGEADNVDTLMALETGSVKKLLAAVNNKLKDITVPQTPTDVKTGFTSDKWQHTTFNTRLIMVNGEDTPQIYDGTTSADISLTGTSDPKTFANVAAFKQRLFFVQKNTLTFWYLPVNQIGGAEASYDLSFLATMGGNLVSMFTFSTDTGVGPDDFACFWTSEGEVIVFQGDDPGVAEQWVYIGTYHVGRPVGLRNNTLFMGRTVILTENGYDFFRFANVVESVNADMLSAPIRNEITRAHTRFENVFGWQIFSYTHLGQLYVSLPETANETKYQQHVLSYTASPPAWSRYRGWNGRCWEEYEQDAYFGAAGGLVFKANDERSDNGLPIEADILPAFNYFGLRGRRKSFMQARAVFEVQGKLIYSLEFNTDFSRAGQPYQTSTTTAVGTPWGSPWGSPWSTPSEISQDWIGVAGMGYNGTIRLRTSTTAQQPKFLNWDVMFDPAGPQ